MERILGSFATVAKAKPRWDDDFADRLHHRYTTAILIVFTIVISTKHYVGDTIHCWCPAQFTDNHEDFTNKVCWVSNTYYVPSTQKHIPEPYEDRAKISYYQWVPLILLSQALLFYLPCLFWRLMNNKAGIDLNNLIETSKQLQHGAYYEYSETNLRFMVRHIDQSLRCKRDYKKHKCGKCIDIIGRLSIACGKRHGNYILVLYLFTKVLYLVNVTGQIVALNIFLGTNYHSYGIDVLLKMIRNEEWAGSGVFPRVTLCDFEIRTFANIQRHTVQCVLPMNLFNEKFYVFLWFWYVFVALTMFLNLGVWIYRATATDTHIRYIRHHLVARNVLQKDCCWDEELGPGMGSTKQEVENFTRLYLRQDGILVLRLIGINANEVASADLVKALYTFYKTSVKGYRKNGKKQKKKKKKRNQNNEGESMNDELSDSENANLDR